MSIKNLAKQVNKIAVLGSGISGLSSAYYASKYFPKAQIYVYEKEKQVGGSIQSQQQDGFVFDLGPRSLRNSGSALQVLRICEEAQILEDIVPSSNSNKVFLYYDKQMRTIPKGLDYQVLKDFVQENPRFLKNLFKLSFQFEGTSREDRDRNISEYIYKKLAFGPVKFQGLGDFFVDILANSVMKGVFRANPEQLSSEVCLQKLYKSQYFDKYLPKKHQNFASEDLQKFRKTQMKGVSSFNFKNGLYQLPQAIEKLLRQNKNVTFCTEHNIKNLDFEAGENAQEIKITSENQSKSNQDKFDVVISTLNAHILSNILKQQKSISVPITRELDSIEHLSMTTTNFGYKGANLIPAKYQCFGALVPSMENYEGVGLIQNSTIFPQLSPENSTSLSLFLSDKLSQKDREDPEKVKFIAKKCIKEMLGIEQEPDVYQSKSWNNFFPVYAPGHMKKAQQLREYASKINPNFYLNGNYLYVGAIPDLMLQSQVTVNMIKEQSQ